MPGPTPPPALTVHFRNPAAPLGPHACGEKFGARTSEPGEVTCFRCRKSRAFLSTQREPVPLCDVVKDLPIREQVRRRWTVAVVGGDTDLSLEDWMNQGVATTTPLHTPPRMEDANGLVDGVFIFADVKGGHELDVRPLQNGDVLFDIGGKLHTLSHLDRMDLVRALLHDFHYSPEKGGPNDDQD